MADMEKHEAFTKWALSQGVELKGVAAHRFAGRGLGIVAIEAAKPNKVLIKVPTSALRTRTTVNKSISSLLPGITTHGLLAADLATDLKDDSSSRKAWHAVLPSHQDFKNSLPLLWSPALQKLLPPAAAKLLNNQKVKFAQDWKMVSPTLPHISMDDYIYCWSLVNTRTFYYTPPTKAKSKTVVDPNENMALNPFADYFNHSSRGCIVEFSKDGFEITTVESIEKGEEVYISYGKHGNDFLLAEYGFVMDDNEWDDVSLDDLVLGAMNQEQRELVKENRFEGRYVLDKQGPCYRTQVALRAMVMPERRWLRYIAGSADDEEADRKRADDLLYQLLGKLKEMALKRLDEIKLLTKDGRREEEQPCGMLIKRWKQILHMAISFMGGDMHVVPEMPTSS